MNFCVELNEMIFKMGKYLRIALDLWNFDYRNYSGGDQIFRIFRNIPEYSGFAIPEYSGPEYTPPPLAGGMEAGKQTVSSHDPSCKGRV